jgi:hypothetical protein
MLTVRDGKYPVVAVVKAFPDVGGMRVIGKWRYKAHDLMAMVPKLHYLGLGVNTNIWHDFFMGFDIVFRPAPVSAEGSKGSD